METKLTLSIEEGIIEKAKSYTKDRNMTLSEMVENYFKSLVSEKNKKTESNSSFFTRLI